jgi:ABC-type polysaccharide/polyol phosphate transport system ATPase subunit
MSTSPSPVALEVSGIHKSFRLPLDRKQTLKERALHPLAREQYQELKVLDDISFEVRRGEFFGIAGRNGSGKSTLLKLIASVYRADRGQIRVAGAIAPVIELGVGFQPELTARENVVLNALMMGLTPHDAKERFAAVIQFAELEEYVHLKLRNYSTGMLARLAFAIAMQTDPDVLLVDEVLAVGDASFQRRCTEAFEGIKGRGDTSVIFVTHSMAQMEALCDRAMMIEGGKIELLGEPAEVALRYQQLLADELVRDTADGLRSDWPERRSPTRITAMRLVTADGQPTDRLSVGGTMHIEVSIKASAPIETPRLAIGINSETGLPIFSPPLLDLEPQAERLGQGDEVHVGIRIENKLAPGRYSITGVIATESDRDDAPVSDPRMIFFEVPPDGRKTGGAISLDYEVSIAGADGQQQTHAPGRSQP